MNYVLWFKECSYKNKELVGGKCSSLGELHNLSKLLNFDIADGFAITTKLYDDFVKENNIQHEIEMILNSINVDNLVELKEKSDYLKSLFEKSKYR